MAMLDKKINPNSKIDRIFSQVTLMSARNSVRVILVSAIVIIASWIYFIYVIPIAINQRIANHAEKIVSNYSSELNKLE